MPFGLDETGAVAIALLVTFREKQNWFCISPPFPHQGPHYSRRSALSGSQVSTAVRGT